MKVRPGGHAVEPGQRVQGIQLGVCSSETSFEVVGSQLLCLWCTVYIKGARKLWHSFFSLTLACGCEMMLVILLFRASFGMKVVIKYNNKFYGKMGAIILSSGANKFN